MVAGLLGPPTGTQIFDGQVGLTVEQPARGSAIEDKFPRHGESGAFAEQMPERAGLAAVRTARRGQTPPLGGPSLRQE